MLKSIKHWKRYCKATSNVFFNKKNFDDEKKNYRYGRFFVASQCIHVKIVQNSSFFLVFFLRKLSKSRFPGKVAALF